MTSHLRLPLTLLFLASAACACAPESDQPPGAAQPTVIAAAPASAVATSPAPPNDATVSGVVRDEAGRPIADIAVDACMATSCLFGKADGDGRFAFTMLDVPVNLAMKTHEAGSAAPRLAAAVFPLRLEGAIALDMGSIFVPELPQGSPLAGADLDPQTVDAGDGLVLTLRRGDLKVAPGADDATVAARRVPPERAPHYADLDPAKVVAIYALSPFATTSRSGIAVRAPSDLPSGTPVRFQTVSELDGLLSSPVAGHADGTSVATDPGEGISELTWLVVSR